MPPVLRTRSALKNGPPAPYTKPERKAKPASTLPTPLPAPVPQVRKRSRDDADDSVDETTLKRSRVESPATTSRNVRSLPKRDAKNTKPAAAVAAVPEKATSRKALPQREIKNTKPAAAVAAVAEKATPPPPYSHSLNQAPPSDGDDSDFDDSDFDDSDFDDSDSDMSDFDDSDSDLSDSDMSDAEPVVRVYVNREGPHSVSKGMGGLFAEMAQAMLSGLDWRTVQFPDSARFSEVIDE
ncbi:hypothetical protein JCM5296_001745 [Sporobolomyces johnsonii]